MFARLFSTGKRAKGNGSPGIESTTEASTLSFFPRIAFASLFSFVSYDYPLCYSTDAMPHQGSMGYQS
jgi:hypothetical protein